MSEAVTVSLDVRDMVPRERHPKIFSQLDSLKSGEVLQLINDHDPVPLRYQLMAERPEMFDWEPIEQGPEKWVVSITRK